MDYDILLKPVKKWDQNREPIIKVNIFYCLNNDKRIRHKFFNLVFSSSYTYNIQYDKHIMLYNLKYVPVFFFFILGSVWLVTFNGIPLSHSALLLHFLFHVFMLLTVLSHCVLHTCMRCMVKLEMCRETTQ
jgi:ABC-type protease/lipase transport system fused ATPase/permease subunit